MRSIIVTLLFFILTPTNSQVKIYDVISFDQLEYFGQKNNDNNKENLSFIPNRFSIINENTKPKFSLNIEGLGRAFFIGTLNFEYILNVHFSIGSGIGYYFLDQKPVTRYVQGIEENGERLELLTSQHLYGLYYPNKEINIFFTTGLINFLELTKFNFPSETKFDFDGTPGASLGIGYEFLLHNVYLRLTGYGLIIKDFGFSPPLIPWGGLTIGYIFQKPRL